MWFSVEFDDELVFRAKEVGHVRAYGNLSSELQRLPARTTQSPPKDCLGNRHFPS